MSLAWFGDRTDASLQPYGRLDAADRLVVGVFTFDAIAVILTQKLAIPLGGRESQIALAFLIHAACICKLGVHGQLRVMPARALLFCLLASFVLLSQIPSIGGRFSLPSMFLMLSIGALLVVATPISHDAYKVLMKRFVGLALVASGLVAVDWLAQLAGLAMPDLEALIPRPVLYYEYNYIQPVEWDSPWMKPNGVFFLETSHVSQFIAVGAIVELALFRRPAIALALIASLLATMGATGIILFASTLPFLLVRASRGILVGALAAAIVLLLVASQSTLVDTVMRRSGEFSQNSSSGYNRFMLPVEWSIQALTGPTDTALLGTGAGSMPKAVNDDEAGIAGFTWPPYTKVGVEYGVIALALWFGLILVSLIQPGIPLIVSWAAFAQYNFLNGSLNVPIHTVYCILLCAGYTIKTSRGANASTRLPPATRARPSYEQKY